MSDWLENFWADLLSEAPDKIRAAWAAISAEERVAVYAHLLKMTQDEEYQPVQRQAAQAAIDVLGGQESTE